MDSQMELVKYHSTPNETLKMLGMDPRSLKRLGAIELVNDSEPLLR